VNTLSSLMLLEEAEKLADERARELASSVFKFGGIPVYPRQFRFADLAQLVERNTAHLPTNMQWVQVPVWMIVNPTIAEFIPVTP
jgi:hypothetical protein